MRPLSRCPQCTRRIVTASMGARATSLAVRGPSSRSAHQLNASRQHRQFSTTPSRPKASPVAQHIKQKRPSQPSLQVLVKQAEEKARREGSVDMSQLGMLPDTYVPPSNPELRRELRWHGIKKRWTDVLSAFITFWSYRKLKPGIDYIKVTGIAADLHERAFKAFAAGNIEKEREVLSESLANQLRNRILRRDAGEQWQWEIVSRPSKPKLVSYMITPLPDSEQKTMGESCMLQAVVQLQTVQKLRKTQQQKERGNSRAVASKPTENVTEKKTTEYAVLQKHVKPNAERHVWKLWGFAQESSHESIAKNKEMIEQMAALQASKHISKS